MPLNPEDTQAWRQAMGSVGKLPPFSAVMNKLMSTLANDDVSFGEVAAVIEQDAVLAGNVLKVVNSAAYGRRGTVNSLRHAVSMLGLAKIRNTAMSLSVSQMWGRMDLHPQWSPKQFHLHSTASAVLADQCALELEVNYPEGAFTAGLLAGVGLLLVGSALRHEYTQLMRCYNLGGETSHPSLDSCERAVIGFGHTDLSAAVLEHWSLPAPIIEAVQQSSHVALRPGPMQLAELLHSARTTATQAGFGIQSWVHPPAGEPVNTLEAIGLGERAEQILANFEAQMQALRPFAA